MNWVALLSPSIFLETTMNILTWFQPWIQYNSAIVQLNELSDSELKELSMSRDEILSTVHTTFWRSYAENYFNNHRN